MLLPRSLRKTGPTALVTCLLVVAGHYGGESQQADDTQLNLIAAPSYATYTQEVAGIAVSGYGAIPERVLPTPVDFRLDVASTKIILTEITVLRPLTPASKPAYSRPEQTTSYQRVRDLRKTAIVPVGRRCVAVPYMRR